MAQWLGSSSSEFLSSRLPALRKRTPLNVSAAALAAYSACLTDKVALIERLPPKYRAEVAERLLAAVRDGYDEQGFARTLHQEFGLVLDRAQKVAKAQVRMARAIIDNAELLSGGVKNAVWLHHADCTLADHKAFDRQRYNLKTGVMLGGKWVLPGSESECTCACGGIHSPAQTPAPEETTFSRLSARLKRGLSSLTSRPD